ncbi:AbrB family transcriptional regulator [Metabacillus sp. 84]|uniref:AbrB family transcriptional regulator n=1 Tax=unclassified Metabacillus TaxID=2675274 RepID=UPI003CF2398E
MKSTLALAKTFVASVSGGLIFYFLHLPLPWILGPLSTLLLYKSIRPGTFYTPGFLKNTAFTITGIYFGASFTIEALAAAGPYFLPYTLLTIILLTFSTASGFFLAKKTGLDQITSVFAAIPGGLSEMVAASDSLKGNVGIVSVLQTIRILSVVFLIPFFVTYAFADINAGAFNSPAAYSGADHPEAYLLWIIPILCGFLFRKSIPASFIVMPLLASALLNIFGMPVPQLPHWLVTAAQVIIGTSIGSKMSISDLRKAGKAGPPFFAYTILLISLSLGLGWLFSHITGVPIETGLLSLAPGGLVEMVLTAESIGGDAAVVSSLQLIRFLFIVLAVPALLKWYFNRKNLHS